MLSHHDNIKRYDHVQNVLNYAVSAIGFTLVEVMIVVLIIGTLGAIAVPSFTAYLDRAKTIRTIADIRTIEKDVLAYFIDHDEMPDSLIQVDGNWWLDPWNMLYQYQNLTVGKGKKGTGGITAMARKDRFLNPLNSDFDLYSMGKDKQTKKPLAPPVSHDDILRANDGGYVGLASKF